MIENLNTRIKRVESEMSEPGRRISELLEDNFTEYFIGRTYQPHEDMLDMLFYSDLSETDKSLVRSYAFLRCANGALPQAVKTFVDAYSVLKYEQDYNLENFLLSWDQDSRTLIREERILGTYAPILKGLIEHFEQTRELRNFEYKESLEFTDGIEEFTKWGLISVIRSNADLIREIALGTLSEVDKKSAISILNGELLAREAADSFLASYDKFNLDSRYKQGLNFFLDRFDIQKNEFASNRNGGQFRPLFRKLRSTYGILWKEKFYEMIKEPIKSRVKTLDDEIGSKGIREEDRIRFMEKLSKNEVFKYFKLFSDEGVDAADLLLASRLSAISSRDQEILKDIVSRRGGLGKYLGVCIVPPTNNEVQYDARRTLRDFCEGISLNNFDQDKTLASILLYKMRSQYEEDFKKDKECTLNSLRNEADNETNDVRKKLIEETLSHFERRKKVSDVKGFVKNLVVIN